MPKVITFNKDKVPTGMTEVLIRYNSRPKEDFRREFMNQIPAADDFIYEDGQNIRVISRQWAKDKDGKWLVILNIE